MCCGSTSFHFIFGPFSHVVFIPAQQVEFFSPLVHFVILMPVTHSIQAAGANKDWSRRGTARSSDAQASALLYLVSYLMNRNLFPIPQIGNASSGHAGARAVLAKHWPLPSEASAHAQMV